MSDLVEKVAAEINWEAFSPHISYGSRTKEFQDAARKTAKAAIATVLKAMMGGPGEAVERSVIKAALRMAANNGIALALEPPNNSKRPTAQQQNAQSPGHF